MPAGILSLPNEIMTEICEQLFPLLRDIHKFPSDVYNLDDDVELIFGSSIRNLRALAMTCRDLREFCRNVFFLIVGLDFNEERFKLKVSKNESFPPSFGTTKFLSLTCFEGKNRHRWSGWESHGAESASGSSQEREKSQPPLVTTAPFPCSPENLIFRTFNHFTYVTTLHVENFPFSITNICSLQCLPRLTTLSIHVPDFDHPRIANIHGFTSTITFPKVRNLNIVVFDIREARSAGIVVKLFEKSIEMLSVKCNDYMDDDFLAALLAGRKDPARLSALKHLNVDLIGFAPGRLQELIDYSTHLESLMIDCHGIPGFLPLFYALDLLRLVIGEDFNHGPMRYYAYEWESPDPDTGALVDRNEEIEAERSIFPYSRYPFWMAPLGRFSCKFKTVQVEGAQRRVVDALELYFAVEDERAESLNENLRLGHLHEVFRSLPTTFNKLQTLVVATESTYTYEGDEPPENLEGTAETLARYFPSAKRIIVRWWDLEPVSWPASSRETASAGDVNVEVDSLWCL